MKSLALVFLLTCELSFARGQSTGNIIIRDNMPLPINGELMVVSSNAAVATARTFVLTQCRASGQVLFLSWEGTNAGELADDGAAGAGATRLSAIWTPTQYDTLQLICNGTDWIELTRAVN